MGSFQARGWWGFFLYFLNAVVRGVTGGLLIRRPDAGAEGITVLLAILFVVGGVFRTVVASVIQFPRWGWTALAGAVSVILGFYLLSNWFSASVFFIGMAIGVDLILDGSALAGFAGAIHSLYKMQTYKAA